jgi:transcriptional regulator with PAS, ATPase and Fis domain
MLVGNSPVMRQLAARLVRVAAMDFAVLIEGESGAGKELVAREIHRLSARRRGPFVPINCAALVETLFEAELFGIEDRTATGVRGRKGKFELAEGGTLFLDEVGDLSSISQAKLLRVLQDLCVERVGGQGAMRIDTRVIAATNRNLGHMVHEGTFRSDLYYRLAGVEVRVPALRERPEDVEALVEHVLAKHRHTRALDVAASALEALASFDWPGNVRQLERVVERALALSAGPAIVVEDLPPEITREFRQALAEPGRDQSLKAWTSRYARLVLERCGGNKRVACAILDISYRTLQTYVRYGSGAGGGDAEDEGEGEEIETFAGRVADGRMAATVGTCRTFIP